MRHYGDSKVASVIPSPSPPDPTSVNSPGDVIATLLADKRGLSRPFQIQIQIQFQFQFQLRFRFRFRFRQVSTIILTKIKP